MQSGHNLYQYPGELVGSEGEVNGADFEDNIPEPCLSMSDEAETEFSTKLNTEPNNPFTKLNGNQAKLSDADSWYKRGKAAKANNGYASDHSFNSTKMIDGYKDFLVGMQKMMAKSAQEENKEKKDAQENGGSAERKKKKKPTSTSKRSKSQRGSESRASRRGTSVSSKSSLALSAIYDPDERCLKMNPDNKKEDAAEFDLNISFSGGYVPNTDLGRVDKGQGNPQFSGLNVN